MIPTRIEKKAEKLATAISHAMGTAISIGLHTIGFIVALSSPFWGGFPWNTVLLVITTTTSLEAIYLSLFAQNTLNGD